MKVFYRTIKIKNNDDIKKAENLKNRNWILYNVGFETLHFYKKDK